MTSYTPNRLTGYQVVLVTPNETRHLGFTIRRSFQGLMDVARRLSPDEWARLGVTADTPSSGTKGRNASLTLTGVGTIRFSGETRYSLWCQTGEQP